MKIVYAMLVAVIGMFAMGCANDGTDEQTIYDRWASTDIYGENGSILKLQEDGHYTLMTFSKSDANNRMEAYVETGSFTHTVNSLSFSPSQRTCPPTYNYPEITYKYTLERGVLTLFNQGVPKEFNTEDAMSTMSNGLTLGCFSDEGFTNSYLQNVN